MLGTAIAVGMFGLVGTAVYFGIKGGDKEDNVDNLVNGFFTVKKALIKYKKVNNGLCSDIKDLKDLIPSGEKVSLDKYRLSIDNKYIVVVGVKTDAAKDMMVEAVGGDSYKREKGVYLSLLSSKKLSKIKPVAKIGISPKENLTTTTLVSYDSKSSVVENDRIVEEEWKGNKKNFSESGKYTIELRIKDKNENWSEWTSTEIEIKEEKGIKLIRGGGKNLYAVLKNGALMVYGKNDYGQFGNGTLNATEELSNEGSVVGCFDVAASGSHLLFLGLDRKVESSGKNTSGELGIGNRNDVRSFQKIWGLDKVKQIECGETFSVALTYDGEVYTWGSNEVHQLGHSSKSRYVEMPKRVNVIQNVKQISVGTNHVLCLLHNGNVFAWGENANGELALGFKSKFNEPAQTELKDIVHICASNGHSFAVNTKGRVIACGSNRRNELGFIGEKEVLFPTEILSLKKIVKIASFNRFALALDEIGQVYGWGQFSSLDGEHHMKPEQVDGLKYVKDIAATIEKGYILTEDDRILVVKNDFENLDELRIKSDEEDESDEED